MITITAASGKPLKFVDATAQRVGYHKMFGFVNEESLDAHWELRKRRGYKANPEDNQWYCQFDVAQGGEATVRPVMGCEIRVVQPGKWRIVADCGEFYILDQARHAVPQPAPAVEEKDSKIFMRTSLVVIALFFAFAIGSGKMRLKDPAEEQERLEQLAKKQKTIMIPKVAVAAKPAEQPKQAAKVERKKDSGAAVAAQLGFLSLLGKKDLTKVAGGMPTQAKRVTAGAGKGGDQGSGGQLLQGLGAGIKRTTVGNSGVAGLGGIGKAGAGGGAGGFGTGFVGSGGPGGGRVLSDVNLAKDVELEGGLDSDVVQATIAKYLSQIRACYERGLRANPGLMGQVTMDFEINATGNLNYAKVGKTSLDHEGVENCISKVMLSWRFPKPVGGTLVNVKYPFMLKPTSHM